MIIIGIGTYFYLKRPTDIITEFDPGNRYDSERLDYMGVIYENRSDIIAFNEGYSESDNCPWGFVHNGIDYFFDNASPVIAAAPGRVESIQVTDNGANVTNRFFITITIRFNSSLVVHYNFEPWTKNETERDQQLEMVNIQAGDWVALGEQIAVFLKAGPGAHIHFGVILNNEWQCPRPYFSADAYTEIMEMIHSFHPDWDLCYP